MELASVNLNSLLYGKANLSRCGDGLSRTRQGLLTATLQSETRQKGSSEQQMARPGDPGYDVCTTNSETTHAASLASGDQEVSETETNPWKPSLQSSKQSVTASPQLLSGG